MKSKHFFATVMMLMGFITIGQAQMTSDDMVKDWERAKAYTKEYLDAMPADKYGFKPTPEMRSFAEQMLHLTDGNYGIAAAAAGVQSPVGMGASEKSADKSKESVSKQVMHLQVYDMSGRTLLLENYQLAQGENNIPVNTASWAKGIYTFRFVMDTGERFINRVMKK